MVDMETPLLVLGVLAGGGLLVPVLSVTLEEKERKLFGYVTILTLLAAIAAVFYTAFIQGLGESTAVAGVFRDDLLGAFTAITVLTVSLLVSAASLDYMEGTPNNPIYYSLLLFTSLGMVLLAFSIDLLMIIVAWELMSLPTYVLAGFRKKDPFSNEGAVKYFILGAFSSGVLLYAISLIYGLTGSTNIYTIINSLSQLNLTLTPVALLTSALFVAGFGLKMSVVPFHMWAPDAYEGAPPTVSALLSAGTKKAGFAAALRVFLVALPLINLYPSWTTAFAFLAILTMILGNIAALTQKVMARLLAYSSIAQAGYMLIGLAVATPLALTGTLYHILNHAVMQSSAFLAVAAVDYRLKKIGLDGYNGLWKKMPVTAISMAVALLALAGVPPLNGFWSKLVLFGAALQGGVLGELGVVLAVVGALTSVLSLGYYATIIKRMYMDEADDLKPVSEPKALTAVLIAATLFIVITGLYPAPIYDFASRAAASVPALLK